MQIENVEMIRPVLRILSTNFINQIGNGLWSDNNERFKKVNRNIISGINIVFRMKIIFL